MEKKLLMAAIMAAAAFFAVPAQETATSPRTIGGGGVINGKATKLVKPVYPDAAKAVNASGTVNVQVTIDEEGKVVSASAVSGHPLLRAAAVEAARASTFSPTLLSGQPVKVTGVVVYNFTGGPQTAAPSYFNLGSRLAVLGLPMPRVRFQADAALANVPSDWTEERMEIERLAGRVKDGMLEPTPEIAAAAEALNAKIEARLGELPADPMRWRFRLGRALLVAAYAVNAGTPEFRKQAAFAIRELAFVNPPGFEVALVNEMSEVSDIIERGNPTDAEKARVSALFEKLEGMFR